MFGKRANRFIVDLSSMQQSQGRSLDKSTKKNGIVYTEDGVPVYTLYLGDIPQKRTVSDLKTYFSIYGEVKSVHIVKKNKGTTRDGVVFQYGFVTFAKAESAAKVLAVRNHPGISKRLKVKPADTWRQPKDAQQTKKVAEHKENAADDPETESKVSIFSLNDDCLLHVFSFLTQAEVLKQAFVCQRFRDLVEHMVKASRQFDFNDMHRNYTLMEIRQTLAWFGEHIKQLRLKRANESYRRYVEFVGMFCHNLEEINFEFLRSIHSETYKRIFRTSSHLKSLILEDCDVNDSICSLISTLAELETLNLTHNRDISGKYLQNLDSVVDLNLSNCENVEASHFIDILKAMKLKSLNIAGCYQLTDEAFDVMVETQPNLERIAMSTSYQAIHLEAVAKLSSLKHLRVHRDGTPYIGSEFLRELAAHRKDALESLEIYNVTMISEEKNRSHILEFKNLKKLCIVRDRSLTDCYLSVIPRNCKELEEVNIAGSPLVEEAGVLDLVQNLKKLKFLNISHSCRFSEDLIPQIYNILECRQKETGKLTPLKLCIHDTCIKIANFKSEKYKEYRNVLTLSNEADYFCQESYDEMSDDSFNDVFDYFHDYIDSDYDTPDDDIDGIFYDDEDYMHADAIFWL